MMGFYAYHEYHPLDQILETETMREELKKHKQNSETISGSMTVNLADGVSVKRLFGGAPVNIECEVAPELDEPDEPEDEQEPEHPDYYKGDNECGRSIEVFDIIDQFVGGDFYLGNVLKYVCRAGKKSADTKRQDLEKALHYIKEAIKRL